MCGYLRVHSFLTVHSCPLGIQTASSVWRTCCGLAILETLCSFNQDTARFVTASVHTTFILADACFKVHISGFCRSCPSYLQTWQSVCCVLPAPLFRSYWRGCLSSFTLWRFVPTAPASIATGHCTSVTFTTPLQHSCRHAPQHAART